MFLSSYFLMSRQKFELFLYKNKLNTMTLIDICSKLSSKTMNQIQQDIESSGMITSIISNENENDKVYIFTDGGCSNNGKPCAKGAYAVFFTADSDSIFYQFNTTKAIVSESTNQKAELLAIQKALEIIVDNKQLFDGKQITIVTDSMYSIKCIETWSKTWLKNNWKTSSGQPVKNKDIIKNIIELVAQICNLKFKHVFSHIERPFDTDTLEYRLWEGNYIVDKMVNELV